MEQADLEAQAWQQGQLCGSIKHRRLVLLLLLLQDK